jgi:hypothetical protein
VAADPAGQQRAQDQHGQDDAHPRRADRSLHRRTAHE